MTVKQPTEKNLVDYQKKYKQLVTFKENSDIPIHKWFPFVEGFSAQLIQNILEEEKPASCFDPFAGTGTTPLQCQMQGVKCYASEVNPFFADVAKTKLVQNYSPDKFEQYIQNIRSNLKTINSPQKLPDLETKTLFETEERDKWIFDREVINGILDIKNSIEELKTNHLYKRLFNLALASILIPVSNAYRDGKCLSYKTNWEETTLSRTEVHKHFFEICENTILPDLSENIFSKTVQNLSHFEQNDCREFTRTLPNNSIDLVITSPPYLNSRDYTDVYRLELWIMGYVSTYVEERNIRKSSLRSHVQVPWEETGYPKVELLESYIDFLEGKTEDLWNPRIISMVKGYFQDMAELFKILKFKLNKSGKIFLNVSNSAYGGKVCEVDKILGQIAEKNGLSLKEIRIARYLSTSAQQSDLGKMRESIIILKNET